MKKDIYAIIETGGKQYKVVPGSKIEVDFLNAGEGNKVDLSKVLFIADNSEHLIGQPLVENASVNATCIEESKGDKVIVFKYKNKVRYRRKKGHRQLYSKLEISDIVKPGGNVISSKKKTVTSGGIS